MNACREFVVGVFAFLFVLALCAFVDAGCRARVVYAAPQVYAATPIIQYQAVQYPLYTATYSGFTASSEAVLAARFDMLGQKLDAFASRLEALAQQGAKNGGPKQANAHPGAAYLQQSCVKCHDSGTAKAKGGGHVLFDLGQLVASSDQMWKMSEQVRKGIMPQGGPKATDEQYNDLLELFEGVATQRAAAKQENKEKAPPPK